MKRLIPVIIILVTLVVPATVFGTNNDNVRVCSVDGLFGTYYNLPSNHPDVEQPSSDIVGGLSPFDQDWYTEQYFKFSRTDHISTFEAPVDYFPVDAGLPGDPYYFAVHWNGVVEAPATSDDYIVTLASDDDSWLFINGEQVLDLSGTHPLVSETTNISLEEGISTIDIYFAERRTLQSGIRFKIDGGVNFSPCVGDDGDGDGGDDNGSGGGEENSLPIFSGPQSVSVIVNELLEFVISADDEDGDDVVLTSILPRGSAFDIDSGTFSWTPTTTGSFIAQFFAFDGTATSTLDVSINVTEDEDENNGGGDDGGSNNGGGSGAGGSGQASGGSGGGGGNGPPVPLISQHGISQIIELPIFEEIISETPPVKESIVQAPPLKTNPIVKTEPQNIIDDVQEPTLPTVVVSTSTDEEGRSFASLLLARLSDLFDFIKPNCCYVAWFIWLLALILFLFFLLWRRRDDDDDEGNINEKMILASEKPKDKNGKEFWESKK